MLFRSATQNLPVGLAQGGKAANANYTVADQSAWVAAFRIHRDIVP